MDKNTTQLVASQKVIRTQQFKSIVSFYDDVFEIATPVFKIGYLALNLYRQ